jgi:hypothetical protein
MTSRNKGWSSDAIKQFNFLISKVDNDRQKHGVKFDEAFRVYLKCKQGVDVGQAAPAAKRYKALNGLMSKQQMMESMAAQKIDAVECQEELDEIKAEAQAKV